MSKIILTLDPSLRAFGWALIKETNKKSSILDGGCIVTTTSLSDIDSLKYISTELNLIVDRQTIDELVFEESIGSKSSRAAKSLAYVKSLVVTLAITRNIPFRYRNAKNAKKSITDSSSATKLEVLNKVCENFNDFRQKFKDLPKFKLYAVSDAVSVYLSFKTKNYE